LGDFVVAVADGIGKPPHPDKCELTHALASAAGEMSQWVTIQRW
jgi:hypothetical protein